MYCNRQPICQTWVAAIHAAAFICILVHKMAPAFSFSEMKANKHIASCSYDGEQNGHHKPSQYPFI